MPAGLNYNHARASLHARSTKPSAQVGYDGGGGLAAADLEGQIAELVQDFCLGQRQIEAELRFTMNCAPPPKVATKFCG